MERQVKKFTLEFTLVELAYLSSALFEAMYEEGVNEEDFQEWKKIRNIIEGLLYDEKK